MLCGLTRIALKIKHYFRYSLRTKYCKCFCLTCKYFDDCYYAWVLTNYAWELANEELPVVEGEIVE